MRATEAIQALGGTVEYDYQRQSRNPPGPPWLRHLLGEDFFVNVVSVSLDSLSVTDADLEHLTTLRQLQAVGLSGTQVTDAGLERLKGLTQLRELDLKSTKVTDEGVKKFQQALPKCKVIR